jgi:hypothetical protein
MPHTTLFSFSLCTLLATAAVAQTPAPKAAKADARAEARAEADAQQSDSSRSSHTSTHRVVVENGRTVVDERTENGSPVPAGGAGPGPAGVPPLPAIDADEMLRKLREQVEREVGGGLPPIPVGGQPLDGRRASDRASGSASDTSKSSGASPGKNTKDAATKGTSGKDSRTAPTPPRPTGDGGKLPPRTDHR